MAPKAQMMRIGRISVHKLLSDQHTKNMARTLGKIGFFPLRVEFRMDLDCFEMAGISEEFDEILYGSTPPFYEIRIRNTDDKGEYVEVIRRGNEEHN